MILLVIFQEVFGFEGKKHLKILLFITRFVVIYVYMAEI